jgi:hypothetical protein
MSTRSPCAAEGFSLIEAVIASSLVATALVTLAQLFVLALAANQSARRATIAVTLAAQKMEDLRALPWDTLRGPARTEEDYVDASGGAVGPGDRSPPAASFRRRWSIVPVAADPDNLLAIDVLVVSTSIRAPVRDAPRAPLPGEAHLATIRTRHVW